MFESFVGLDILSDMNRLSTSTSTPAPLTSGSSRPSSLPPSAAATPTTPPPPPTSKAAKRGTFPTATAPAQTGTSTATLVRPSLFPFSTPTAPLTDQSQSWSRYRNLPIRRGRPIRLLRIHHRHRQRRPPRSRLANPQHLFPQAMHALLPDRAILSP